MDRASVFGTEGWEFDSPRAHNGKAGEVGTADRCSIPLGGTRSYDGSDHKVVGSSPDGSAETKLRSYYRTWRYINNVYLYLLLT